MAVPIRYLEHEQIDKAKWDALIKGSANGTPYALFSYLNFMALDWGALVEGDYEHVMPLPYAKKYGIRFIYQPDYIAQLGLIGPGVTPDRLRNFLTAIPARFKYIDFSLNASNLLTLPNFPIRQRSNYVLDLNQDIKTLRAGYRDSHLRNLKRAEKYGLRFNPGLDIAKLRELPPGGLSRPDSQAAFAIMVHLNLIDTITCGVEDKNGQLLASCALVHFKNRLYYVVVNNHPNGRTLGASHMLIDGIIEHFSEKALFLDFEGSDVSSLAFFYSGFGAQLEPYAAIKWNRLPFWLKWLVRN